MAEFHHGANAVLRRRDHSGYLRGGMSSSYHTNYFHSFWPSWYNYQYQELDSDKDLSDGPIDESFSPEPTPQPSAPPTDFPTFSPTQDVFHDGEGSPGVCPQGKAHIQVEVRTDSKSCETSWTLEVLPDGLDNLKVVDFEDGYLQDTHYVKTICVDGGIYVFTISDSYGDGIDEPGFYKVMVDGKSVAYGTHFYNSESTWILVSAEPAVWEEMAWTTSSSTTHVLSGEGFDYILDEDLQELRETLPTDAST